MRRVGTARCAFMFPGQGSQYVGMARPLLERHAVAREVLDEASEAAGTDLGKLMLDGPADELAKSENVQPAILAHCQMLVRILKSEYGLVIGRREHDCVLGHSLGEFAALCAIGKLRFSDAVRLVRKRGALMDACPPGAMCALFPASRETVDRIVTDTLVALPEDVLRIAAVNSAQQHVLSGSPAAIAKAQELAKEYGVRRAAQLPVSGAFHSPLMSSAAAGFKTFQSDFKTDLRPGVRSSGRSTFISTVTGGEVVENITVGQLLVGQFTKPVLWKAAVEASVAKGCRQFIEIGPSHSRLHRLAMQIVDDETCHFSSIEEL